VKVVAANMASAGKTADKMAAANRIAAVNVTMVAAR
jgi:hypothetical protein